MDLALREIADGKMTYRKASIAYGIPKSTLHDHVSGKVKAGAGVGVPKYLTDEEEDEVVRWLEGCAIVGCAKSIREVRVVVGAIVAKKLGVECTSVSHGWWDRFRQWHPHLTMRAGEALAYRRAVASSPETIKNYFDQLEEILVSNSLYNCPSRIYNIDESGFPLQHRPGKRIGVRGQKHVVVNTSGDKTQITVLACVRADGCYMPPMVVFKRSDLKEDLIQGEVPDTLYGLSKSGWMDGDLFAKWFHFHFLKHAPSERPILILLDGHSSHYNPKVIREAALAGVILFCLPPNITHIAQPLDVTPFHSLKSYWYNACDQYMSSHPGKKVTIYNFSELFSQAWYQAMIPRTVMSGFRATGVYPFNRRAISIPGVEESTGTPTAKLAYQQGIKYLPFHSPHHVKLSQVLQSSEELRSSGQPQSQQTFKKMNFTEEENRLFEKRYEEGYDLPDTRYHAWLHQRKTSVTADDISPPTDDCHHSHNVPSVVKEKSKEPLWSEFLTIPSPAYKKTDSFPGQARVLISTSFLKSLEEKEKKKNEAAEEKERRKREREEKRALKEKEKEQKRKEKEQKRSAPKQTRSKVQNISKGKQKSVGRGVTQRKLGAPKQSSLSSDDQFSTLSM